MFAIPWFLFLPICFFAGIGIAFLFDYFVLDN